MVIRQALFLVEDGSHQGRGCKVPVDSRYHQRGISLLVDTGIYSCGRGHYGIGNLVVEKGLQEEISEIVGISQESGFYKDV